MNISWFERILLRGIRLCVRPYDLRPRSCVRPASRLLPSKRRHSTSADSTCHLPDYEFCVFFSNRERLASSVQNFVTRGANTCLPGPLSRYHRTPLQRGAYALRHKCRLPGPRLDRRRHGACFVARQALPRGRRRAGRQSPESEHDERALGQPNRPTPPNRFPAG